MEFVAKRFSDWTALRADLGRPPIMAATPFQSTGWLDAWYASLGDQTGVAAVPVACFESDGGQPIAAFPLILRNDGHLRIIEFADLGVTDYNAPLLLAPDAYSEMCPMEMIGALRPALPAADILRLVKMPARIGRVTNPLAHMAQARPGILSANAVRIDGSWEDYRRKTLDRKFRKEMERSWRVFERDGVDARFEPVGDLGLALRILAKMETLQETRINDLGLPFILNQPQYAAFFKELLAGGLAEGDVVLTALRSGEDDLAAALIGIRAGESYAMVRLAQDLNNWSQCSPGKLIIDRTMHWLHGEGLRHFDFTTGNYTYKNSFKVEREPLFDASVPLSIRGRLHIWRKAGLAGAKQQINRSAPLRRVVRSLKSKVDDRHRPSDTG